MSVRQMERTTFESPRASEYFDARELQAQTGQPAENFASVALKELVDNALDACEMRGVAPEVEVDMKEEGETIRLHVSDNGSGIPSDTVRRVLDFDTRTSDKAAYRTPTRGAQGNALKTVVGIPFALGSKEPVVIKACGVRHEVLGRLDPAGVPRVDHEEKKVPTALGTRVSLTLPAENQTFEPDYWARGFSLFNPHASVRIRHSKSSTYQR